jgi:hypothetical protein
MRIRWGVVAALLGLGAMACLVQLFLLPGRTSQHARVSLDAAYERPSVDGFHIGSLRWNLQDYQHDSKLIPLRQFFTERCRDSTGLPAARCISEHMARAFPHGLPKSEFVDAAYDPVSDLEAHLRGEPGDCVTRSGLIAAILLSAGIPARQLQIIPADAHGHNVLEVFDSRWGWVLFDPTYGSVFDVAAGPGSARDALVLGTPVRRLVQATAPSSLPYYDAAYRARDLIYPDPWLYTRSGARAATWPFRGLFVHAGDPVWRYGAAQTRLRPLAFLLALAATAAFIAARAGMDRRPTTRSPPEVVKPRSPEPRHAAQQDLGPRV